MKRSAIYLTMIFMTAVLLGLHLLMYLTITGFLAITDPAWIMALRVIFIALALAFPLASLAAFRFNNAFTRALYRLSCWWFGDMVYALAGAFLLCTAVLIFGLAAGSGPIIFTVIGLYGAALLLGLYGAVNASHLRVTKVSVSLPDLPPQWKGRSVVLASDTHFGQVRALGFAKKLNKVISGLDAEAVLFCGDFYDGVLMDLPSVADEFGKIRTRLGTFFVTGNHEGYAEFALGYAKPLDALRAAGFKILANESVDLDGITLAGVDFAASEKKEDFIKILKDLHIEKDAGMKPSILLKHTPFFLEEAAAAGISLELCGHTHLGQQFPFMYIAQRLFKGHAYGLTRQGRMHVYTSSGAGTWGPCLRIGTRAEIALITFV